MRRPRPQPPDQWPPKDDMISQPHRVVPAKRVEGIRRTPSRGSWSEINVALDAFLLVVLVGLCIAAVIVRFVFPPGPAAAGWTLWGLDYDSWNCIQFGLLSLLAVGVLVHVMFHWSWVCNVLASRLARGGRGRVDEGMQTIYGVALLIVLLNVIGITVAAAMLMIQGPA